MIQNILHPQTKSKVSGPVYDGPAIVYVLISTDRIKVGFTRNSNTLPSRLAHYQTETPNPLSILYTIDGSFKIEQIIHKALKEYKIRGEWYHNKPEVLTIIKQHVGNWAGPEPYHHKLNLIFLYFKNTISYEEYETGTIY